ncbi:Aste57867_12491 [Aphanomyces stellatus]|uniref:Aste57867_12491 protein n=1 Tax=Aphanomyces stellatus TaxID=120398 RepID=A0A485KW53_9STRA|nr:hypothetical protein As57867_012445 [Aphanomyces stellatus]VFT89342.1 Aste57867_12491 [Aphanomyces stellatus]
MGNCSGRDLEAVEERAHSYQPDPRRTSVQQAGPPRRSKSMRQTFQESVLRTSSKSFMKRSTSIRQRFSLSFMSRQESDIPIAEDTAARKSSAQKTEERKLAPRTPETEYYRSDTDDEGISIDIDLILGNEVDSPGVIHARWGESADDEEEVCTEYKANPFKLGFCINCQKQHEMTESGEVKSTKEYKRISTFTVWQMQLPTNPNISIAPEARVGVGRLNMSYSQRLRLSTLSDGGGRESDVDLTEILRQRRDILLQLQQQKIPPTVSPREGSWL